MFGKIKDMAPGSYTFEGLTDEKKTELAKAVSDYVRCYFKAKGKGELPVMLNMRSGVAYVVVREHEAFEYTPPIQIDVERIESLKEALFIPCTARDLNRLRQVCHKLGGGLSVITVEGGAMVQPRQGIDSVQEWVQNSVKSEEAVELVHKAYSVRPALMKLGIKTHKVKKIAGRYFLVRIAEKTEAEAKESELKAEKPPTDATI
jgi:hypothetical protein